MKRRLTNLFDELPNSKKSLETNFEYGISVSRNLKGFRKEAIVNVPTLNFFGAKIEKYVKNVLKNELKNTFKIDKAKNILIVGLGNINIENDSLGPKTLERLIVSRGLNLSPSVCTLVPNVQSNTGIETFETICQISKLISPDLVILIDAFATVSVSRLCSCFQFSEKGIAAGSGNNHASKIISKEALGARKVLSIGVPTLIYASSFAKNISNKKIKEEFNSFPMLMLSPTDVKKNVELISRIISGAINETLFPNFSPSEINALIK